MKRWKLINFWNKPKGCPGCAERDRRIAELEEENRKLKQRIVELEEKIQALEKKLRELESRCSLNSRNSSIPPSKDPPNAPPRPQKIPSGRNPGGQPGHDGHSRELIPTQKVDKVISVKPEHCKCCGDKLHGNDPSPTRHQVSEIPEIKPFVTEFQLHSLLCKKCNTITTATLPDEVPKGAFGPRLQAMVGICSGAYHLSKRTIEGLMDDLFSVPMSLGSVSACEQAVSQALQAPVEEARQFVEQQPVGYADETGWRENRKKAWLWTLATTQVTVFLILLKRSGKAARELLGSFSGVLVSDRWKAYKSWNPFRHQICWAHLIRDFTRLLDLGKEAAKIGQALLDETKIMFQWWHRVRDGTLSRSSFQIYIVSLRQRVRALLEKGTKCPSQKVAGTCRDILSFWPCLWVFARMPGVEPTNNAAERAIRPAVLWRKGCFGTSSAEGSRFVERMLTVSATLKQQGRNIVDYVTAACHAQLLGKSAPSLLPVVAKVKIRKSA